MPTRYEELFLTDHLGTHLGTCGLEGVQLRREQAKLREKIEVFVELNKLNITKKQAM